MSQQQSKQKDPPKEWPAGRYAGRGELHWSACHPDCLFQYRETRSECRDVGVFFGSQLFDCLN